MIDNFSKCLSIVLKYEGGKSNNSHDPGGRTNEGITQNTYNAWLRKQGRSPSDVFNIPAADRDAIYKNEFWDLIGGNNLPSGVDLVVFDFAVNSGPKRAAMVYDSVAKLPPADCIKAVCELRLKFMRGLSTWAYFGRAWTKRVNDCQKQALVMVGVQKPVPTGPATTSVGAILATIGAVLGYLQNSTGGHVLVFLIAGLILMATGLILGWTKSVAVPTGTTPSLPQNPADKMEALLKERSVVDTKILELEPEFKAYLAALNNMLGQIHPVVIAGPTSIQSKQEKTL